VIDGDALGELLWNKVGGFDGDMLGDALGKGDALGRADGTTLGEEVGTPLGEVDG
jgi:outer membrane lipoprotein SlyB